MKDTKRYVEQVFLSHNSFDADCKRFIKEFLLSEEKHESLAILLNVFLFCYR